MTQTEELIKALMTPTTKKTHTSKNKSLRGKKKRKRRKSMGLPPAIADGSCVFVRQFRWTMNSKSLTEYWLRKVSFNFGLKQIQLEAYEVMDNGKCNIIDWARDIPKDEPLEFTTYDGCGVALYRYKFYSIQPLYRKVDFDYASSDCAIHQITLSYEEDDYEASPSEDGAGNPIVDVPKTVPKKGFDWTARIITKNNQCLGEELPVTVDVRPTLNVEETEINFLNSKTWIPGKSAWEDITLKLPKQSQRLLKNLVWGRTNKRESYDLGLYLYTRDKKLLERWVLKGVWVNAFKEEDDGSCKVTLRYNSVEYHSEQKATKRG